MGTFQDTEKRIEKIRRIARYFDKLGGVGNVVKQSSVFGISSQSRLKVTREKRIKSVLIKIGYPNTVTSLLPFLLFKFDELF